MNAEDGRRALLSECLILTAELSRSERTRLSSAVARRRAFKLSPGAFVETAVWRRLTPNQRLVVRTVAAQHSIPGSVVSGEAAAVLAGLPTWRVADRIPVDLCLPRASRPRPRPGVRLHRSYPFLDDAACMLNVGGRSVPVAPTAASALDAARFTSQLAGIVPLEYAWHNGMAGETDIAAYLDAGRRLRNVASARAIAGMAGPWSESPAESVVKMRLLEAGLPMPVQQAEIYDAAGNLIARVDFLFPEVALVLEYDGRAKTTGEAGYATALRELHRHRRLSNTGVARRHIDAEAARDRATFTEIARLYESLRGQSRPMDPSMWSAPPSPELWDAGYRYRNGRDRPFFLATGAMAPG